MSTGESATRSPSTDDDILGESESFDPGEPLSSPPSIPTRLDSPKRAKSSSLSSHRRACHSPITPRSPSCALRRTPSTKCNRASHVHSHGFDARSFFPSSPTFLEGFFWKPPVDRTADATARTNAGWLHPSARRTSARTVALGTTVFGPLLLTSGNRAVNTDSPHRLLASGSVSDSVTSPKVSSIPFSCVVVWISSERQRASTVDRAVSFAIVSLSGNSDRFFRRCRATRSSLVCRTHRTLRSAATPTKGRSIEPSPIESARALRRTRTRPRRHDTVAGKDSSRDATVAEFEEKVAPAPSSSESFTRLEVKV